MRIAPASTLWNCTLVLLCASAPARAADVVAARVNGEPITAVDVERLLADPRYSPRLREELGAQAEDAAVLERLAVEKLIHRRLMAQEAGRRGIRVPDRELDQAIAALRRRFADLKSFGEWMRQQGLTDRALFESVRQDVVVARVRAALVSDVRLGAGDVEQHYDDHRQQLVGDEVRLQIIVLRDRETAVRTLKAAIEGGEDFGALARRSSVGLRAAQGGDTGFVALDALPAPLADLVRGLEPGQATGPLERGEEFALVRLHERRAGRRLTLDEARPRIEVLLLRERQRAALDAWLEAQQAGATIEILRGGSAVAAEALK